MAEFQTVMKEKKRMCGTYLEKSCAGCPLDFSVADEFDYCENFLYMQEERAEKLVMDWAAAHPRDTRKDHFFKLFPNAKKNKKGIPTVCSVELGWTDEKICEYDCDCVSCWNQPWDGEDHA